MKKRTLVLCVDHDDDIGKKAHVKSPVIGEEDNLKAAQALALADPTESDVNAIYQAVKMYRELKKDGEDVEVATIAGHKNRGYQADKRVISQLEKTLKEMSISDIVFVSDGADDESIIPLMQSRVKVSSVKTVIVKQAKDLEKGYYVIKEVLRDPYFARLIFGLPGIVLAIYGVVHLLNIQEISLNLILGLVGIYLVLKGFGIEEISVQWFNAFRKTASVERASFPLYVASLSVLALGIWAGFDNITFVQKNLPADVIIEGGAAVVMQLSAFFQALIPLLVFAAVFFFAGRIGDMYYRKEYHKITKYSRSLVSAVALYVVLDQLVDFVLYWTGAVTIGPTFADLIIAVISSFIITVIGFSFIKYLYVKRYVMRFIKKGLEVKNTGGEALGIITFIDFKNKKFGFEKEEKKKESSFGRVSFIGENSLILS